MTLRYTTRYSGWLRTKCHGFKDVSQLLLHADDVEIVSVAAGSTHGRRRTTPSSQAESIIWCHATYTYMINKIKIIHNDYSKIEYPLYGMKNTVN